MTVSPFEIPLTPNSQAFSIDLNGTTYNLSIVWNWVSTCWVLDIADVNGVQLLCGVPLITGADLLSQMSYLGLGGSLLTFTDTAVDDVPTLTNLGASSHLYYVTVAP